MPCSAKADGSERREILRPPPPRLSPGVWVRRPILSAHSVDGCDGLARQPGLVGNYKPGLQAPGIPNLYFAGDTYVGRGLAINGASLSSLKCADLILKDLKK